MSGTPEETTGDEEQRVTERRTGGSASSLIPDTLKGMDDPEFKRVQDALREKGQRAITADEQRRTQRSLDR